MKVSEYLEKRTSSPNFVLNVVIILILTGLVWKWISFQEKRANYEEQVATAKWEQIRQDNEKRFEEIRGEIVSLQQERDLLHAENTRLRTERVRRDAERQQDRDQFLQIQKQMQIATTDVLTSRWKELLELSPEDILPVPAGTEGSVIVSDGGVRKTVIALEELPLLRRDVLSLSSDSKNLQQELANKDAEIVGLNTEVLLEREKYGRFTSEHVAEVEKLTSTNERIQSEAKSGKRKWFMVGISIGVLIVSIL